MTDPLRELPPVNRLLAQPGIERLLVRFDRESVVQGCRDVLDELRRAVADGYAVDAAAIDEESILERVEARLTTADETILQRVVNATGAILPSTLGRALLPDAAVNALVETATQPVNIEYDLAQADRGRREQTVEHLLMELTSAEAATVVNNNAAAVLLALSTVAPGKEVVIAQAELAAGDATFRARDAIAASGALLKAAGNADGASPADYEAALSERTAAFLLVHGAARSGDAADRQLAALSAIAKRRGLTVIEDIGAGALVDLTRYGVPKTPIASERLALGAAVVTFSADKLLGGPQAGVLVGGSIWLRVMSANPLRRALQCGKLTIAALEATLRLYRQSAYLPHSLPALRALARPLADVEETARRALPALASALGVGFRVSLQDSTSHVGDGVLPAVSIPTKVLVIEHDYMGPTRIASRFRQARPPIIGRVQDDWFVLDARTIFDALELVPNWTDELEGPVTPGP